MEKTKLDEITGWFAGRLPDGWFTGAPSVTTDDKQVLVVGTLDAPAARKHLKNWLHKRSKHQKEKSAVRDLLPPEDAHVCFATCEDDA